MKFDRRDVHASETCWAVVTFLLVFAAMFLCAAMVVDAYRP